MTGEVWTPPFLNKDNNERLGPFTTAQRTMLRGGAGGTGWRFPGTSATSLQNVDVIVIDDSDDEELPPTKRPRVETPASQEPAFSADRSTAFGSIRAQSNSSRATEIRSNFFKNASLQPSSFGKQLSVSKVPDHAEDAKFTLPSHASPSNLRTDSPTSTVSIRSSHKPFVESSDSDESSSVRMKKDTGKQSERSFARKRQQSAQRELQRKESQDLRQGAHESARSVSRAPTEFGLSPPWSEGLESQLDNARSRPPSRQPRTLNELARSMKTQGLLTPTKDIAYNPFKADAPETPKRDKFGRFLPTGLTSGPKRKATIKLGQVAKDIPVKGPITMEDVQLYMDLQLGLAYLDILAKTASGQSLESLMQRGEGIRHVFTMANISGWMLDAIVSGKEEALDALNMLLKPYLKGSYGRPSLYLNNSAVTAPDQVMDEAAATTVEHPNIGGKTMNWKTFQAYTQHLQDDPEALDQVDREASPLGEADYYHRIYQVQFRQVTTEQLNEGTTLVDAPFVEFGTAYEDPGKADAHVRRLAHQKLRGVPCALEISDDYSSEFSLDGEDRQKVILSCEAGIVECCIRTSLRTNSDKIMPKSKDTWLPKTAYFVIVRTVTRHLSVTSVAREDNGAELEDLFGHTPPPPSEMALSETLQGEQTPLEPTGQDLNESNYTTGAFFTMSENDTEDLTEAEFVGDVQDQDIDLGASFDNGDVLDQDFWRDDIIERRTSDNPPEAEIGEFDSVQERLAGGMMYTHLAHANTAAIEAMVKATFVSTSSNLIQRAVEEQNCIKERTQIFEDARQDEYDLFAAEETRDNVTISVQVQKGQISGPRNI